eukprot:m.303049 g.303049  ORF g.303049 m.303049 type:complete len:1525 (-) comp15891_c1_seq3:507-5081(-)
MPRKSSKSKSKSQSKAAQGASASGSAESIDPAILQERLAVAPFQSSSANDILSALSDLKDQDGYGVTEDFEQLPTRKELPLYYQIISKPIDLNQIRKRCKSSKYSSMLGFYNDLNLMCENATVFNEPESQIHSDALQIKQKVNELFSDIGGGLVLKLQMPKRSSDGGKSKKAKSTGSKGKRKPSKRNVDESLDGNEVVAEDAEEDETEAEKGHEEEEEEEDEEEEEEKEEEDVAVVEVDDQVSVSASAKRKARGGTRTKRSKKEKGAKQEHNEDFREGEGEGKAEQRPLVLKLSTEAPSKSKQKPLSKKKSRDKAKETAAAASETPSKAKVKGKAKAKGTPRRRTKREKVLDSVLLDPETPVTLKITVKAAVTKQKLKIQLPSTSPIVCFACDEELKVKPQMQCRDLFNMVRFALDASDDRELSDMFLELPPEDMPMYYDVISNPISLEQIDSRIKENQYEAVDQCVADFKLMFHNAKQYNEPGSEVYTDAETLLALVEQKLPDIKATGLAKHTPLHQQIKANVDSTNASIKKMRQRLAAQQRRKAKVAAAAAAGTPGSSAPGTPTPSDQTKGATDTATPSAKRVSSHDMSVSSNSASPLVSGAAAKVAGATATTSASNDVSSVSGAPGGASAKTERKRSKRSLDPKTMKGKQLYMYLYQVVSKAKDESGETLCEPFQKLPSKKEYPDYYLTVSEPRDLSMIQTSIKNDVYTRASAFATDMCLVFTNALIYNDETSDIYKSAQHLLALFQSECRRLLPSSVLESTACLKPDPPLVTLGLELLASLRRAKKQGHLLALEFYSLPDPAMFKEYYQTIEQPITLSIIHEHLLRHEYRTLEQLLTDFRTMFQNARQFNEKDSFVYNDATELERRIGTSFQLVAKKMKISAACAQEFLETFKSDIQDSAKATTAVLADVEFQDDLVDGELMPCVDVPAGFQVNLQDYVLIENKAKPSEPIVATVDKIWQSEGGTPYLKCVRFYRPQETFHVATRMFYKAEVLASSDAFVFSADQILRKCYVFWVRDYVKWMLKPDIVQNEDVYLCESRYNSRGKSIKPIKLWTRPKAQQDIVVKREKHLALSSLERVKSIFADASTPAAPGATDPRSLALTPQPTDVPAALQGVTFYQVLFHKGVPYTLGDIVYVSARGSQENKHHIVRIDKLWVDTLNRANFSGCRFLYPHETSHPLDTTFYTTEVIASSASSSHALDNIQGPCCVASLTDYQSKQPLFTAADDVYVCLRMYRPQSASLVTNSTEPVRLTQLSEFVQLDEPKPLFTVPSPHVERAKQTPSDHQKRTSSKTSAQNDVTDRAKQLFCNSCVMRLNALGYPEEFARVRGEADWELLPETERVPLLQMAQQRIDTEIQQHQRKMQQQQEDKQRQLQLQQQQQQQQLQLQQLQPQPQLQPQGPFLTLRATQQITGVFRTADALADTSLHVSQAQGDGDQTILHGQASQFPVPSVAMAGSNFTAFFPQPSGIGMQLPFTGSMSSAMQRPPTDIAREIHKLEAIYSVFNTRTTLNELQKFFMTGM